ncbi:hypothetical protein FRB94_000068 [Tulasnella sp. JGI-2019a]|nr:hypothetical protein FRB94_000068 [Tulasnella sp. JGI-2019a]KAG9015753.1 hypothetical protein FRB93_012318 [Tulasnella sp. JGI-2019a]KAG9039616.1 hypothetical protein FRB95_009196 [Tulasnella sp. JGI-2019a]
MALSNPNDEGALIAVWQLVAELSEQLNANRAATAALQAQAGVLKGQAVHNGTGFVLRRFNTDLSKETFESEVERMNAALIIENQQLQHENKQFNVLLKEYEQTLETVMSKFRSQAHAAQQHELTLTRHYESLLLSRETSVLNQDLTTSTKLSASLSRLSSLIRKAIRANAGEDPEETEPFSLPDNMIDPVTGELVLPGSSQGSSMIPTRNSQDSDYPVSLGDGEDWAIERESEINRLEKENEELRKLLGIDAGSAVIIGASEEEWSGTDSIGQRRLQTGLNRGSIALGRKPSLLGSRGGGPSGFTLQNRGWMDKPLQEGIKTPTMM